MPTLDDLGHGAHNAATGAGSAAGSGLKHKVGPLAVWQWGAALAGLILAYAAYRLTANGASQGPSTVAPAIPVGDGSLQSTIDPSTLQGEIQQALDQATAAGAANTPAPSLAMPSISSDVANLYASVGVSPSGIDPQGEQFWQSYIDVNGLNAALAAIDNTNAAKGFAATDPTAFVAAQYNATEGSVDPAGEAYWVGQLQSGLGAGQEAQQFATAVQANQTGNPKATLQQNPVKG